MKETEFIRKNKEKWQEFEHILKDPASSPEDLSKVFIQTTDDLSYARTRYRNRSVRVYLNELAQKIYQGIYSGKHTRKKTSFWGIAAPSAMYYSRIELLISAVVFLLAVGIGLISSHFNPDFPKIILGDSYVAMTEANIENGDPMAVYKDMDALPMFFMIAWNNIRVSFIVFVAGVFFSLGTIVALIRNGVMVGAFLAFFIQRDLFSESFFAIMLHGTLELSCIVLAGAAGLTLGRGLLFPGSYSRLQSFLMSARSGIKVMLVVTPFLVLAAAIESFATRFTDVPDIVRGLVILISLGIVIAYFVVLPRLLAQSGKLQVEKHELRRYRNSTPKLNEIKRNGQVFNEAILILRQSLPSILKIGFISGVASTLLMGFGSDWRLSEVIDSDYFYPSFDLMTYLANLFWFPDDIAALFDLSQFIYILPVFIVTFFFLFRLAHKRVPMSNQNRKMAWQDWVFPLLLTTPIIIGVFINSFLGMLFGMSVSVYIIYWDVFWQDERNLVPFLRYGTLFFSRASSVIGMTFLLLGFHFVCMFLLNAPIAYMVFDFVQLNFKSDWALATEFPYFLYAVMTYTIIYTLSFLTIVAFILHYYSSLEVVEARQLQMEINELGRQKRSYGIKKEI